MGDEKQEQDCAVCLQKCHHPTQLPCGHVFCFLCVKGVAIQSRKCAMCRAEIPPDYLDHPILLEELSPQNGSIEEPQVENQWYYEGRNGWWKYDERSNLELETEFTSGKAESTLLLAGALYCIDFQSMTQVRCSDPTRRRRVRRDTPLFPAKGVAGIKVTGLQATEEVKSDTEDNLNLNIDHDNGEVIEILDDENEENIQIIQIDDLSDDLDRLSFVNSEEP